MSHPIEELRSAGFRPRQPKPREKRSALYVVLIGFAVAAIGLRTFLPQPIAFFPGSADETIYVDPARGWMLRYPSSWHEHRFSEVDKGGVYTTQWHGVMLSNVDHDFVREHGGDISWSPWFEMDGLPATAIALQVMHVYGGGFGIFCRYDSPLPLKLGNEEARDDPVLDTDGNPMKKMATRFIYRGTPYYSAHAWIGAQASKEDIATLHEIVGSISYEPVGDPEYGHENCLESY